MTVHRILDLVLYAFSNYIAYIPLVFYSFRKRMRYPKPISYGAMGMIGVGFLLMTYLIINGLPTYLIPILSVLGASVVMYWGLEVHLGKTLMVLLMEYSNASFITVMAKNVEMLVFPDRTHSMYCWTHSIFIIVGVLCLWAFNYFVTWRRLDNVINMPHDSSAWKYIWITPLSFYLVWFIYVYTSQSYLEAIPESPVVLMMLFFLEIGSMVTYFILIQLIYYEEDKSRLEHQKILNEYQYKHLSNRIDEARKSRHDLRHHFLILDTMANEGNMEGVKEYLDQYSEKHAQDDVLLYCDNYAANAVFSYYAQIAKEAGIEFTVNCSIPEEAPIPNTDLTVVFGNLIENALNACYKVTDRTPVITLSGRNDSNYLMILIKNSASEAPRRDADGRYLSSSHKGHGVGIESIRSIVESYSGIMNIEHTDSEFSVSIMIPVKKDQTH